MAGTIRGTRTGWKVVRVRMNNKWKHGYKVVRRNPKNKDQLISLWRRIDINTGGLIYKQHKITSPKFMNGPMYLYKDMKNAKFMAEAAPKGYVIARCKYKESKHTQGWFRTWHFPVLMKHKGPIGSCMADKVILGDIVEEAIVGHVTFTDGDKEDVETLGEICGRDT